MKRLSAVVLQGLYDDTINELDQVYPPKQPTASYGTLALYLFLVPLILLNFLSLPYIKHLLPLLPFGRATLALLFFTCLSLTLSLFSESKARSPESRKWAHTLASLLIFPQLYQTVISMRYLEYVFSQQKAKDPGNVSVAFFTNLASLVVYLPCIAQAVNIWASKMILTTKHSGVVVKSFLWWQIFQLFS